MRHGDNRHFLADHFHNFTGAITSGIDDIFGRDLALVGDDAPAIVQRLQCQNLGEAVHLAAQGARALGIGLGQLAGVNIAVQWIE